MSDVAEHRYVLPSDVLVFPVDELPASLREGLAAGDSRWAVTRPRSRTLSRVVDDDSAELLECFRSPTTIVDAVLEFAGRRGADPEEVLTSAYQLLTSFRRSRLLVPEDAHVALPIAPTLEHGEVMGGVEVVRPVQVLEDSELYLGRLRELPRRMVALKLLQPDAGPIARWQLQREVAILDLLGGDRVAVLRGSGVDARRPYLVTDWIPGVDARTAARRAQPDTALVGELVVAVLDAYAALHARGVLHGDVHPGNVLVLADGGVTLCDFGVARIDGDGRLGEAPRAGIGPFFEPEYAAALLAGRPPPPTSAAGEQYALGALAYLLLTGDEYADFGADSDELLRQIVTEPPRPFASRWRAVEAVVGRALAKEPAARFASVAAFRDALAAAVARGPAGRRARPAARPPALDAVVDELRTASSVGSPPGSFTYGAAGAAFGLARLSVAREDPELLALADVWLARAERQPDEAFYDGSIRISPATVTPGAPHHTPAGVHAAHGVIAHLTSDERRLSMAVERFVAAAAALPTAIDLTMGAAGVLVGAAVMLALTRAATAPAGLDPKPIEELVALGDRTAAHLCEHVEGLGPAAGEATLTNPAMAHGWAGLIHAILQWSAVRERPGPSWLPERIDELAAVAEPAGRGLRWPVDLSDPSQGWMDSWCNGAPGLAHLFVAAAERFGEERWSEIAERCAWNAWEAPAAGLAGVCCGLAGRAYALAAVGRHTGDRRWMDRARQLADDAAAICAARPFLPESLYKGTLGVAVVHAELAEAAGGGEHARQPLFELEAW